MTLFLPAAIIAFLRVARFQSTLRTASVVRPGNVGWVNWIPTTAFACREGVDTSDRCDCVPVAGFAGIVHLYLVIAPRHSSHHRTNLALREEFCGAAISGPVHLLPHAKTAGQVSLGCE